VVGEVQAALDEFVSRGRFREELNLGREPLRQPERQVAHDLLCQHDVVL